MESRQALIEKGLSYLGKSDLRREVYRRVNGRNTASDIARGLKAEYPKVSVNQVLNELKRLDKHLVRVKKKIGKNKIYEKIPEYVPLRLQDRKTLPRTMTTGTRQKSQRAPFLALKRLLRFKGKYPETVFYDRLEDEINLAYSFPKLPNAVLLLSRKLIENLVYNLIEYKFGPKKIQLYYDVSHRRAQDFGVLLDNLKNNMGSFHPDEMDLIEKFLELVHPFRRDANSKAHKVIEYLDNMGSVRGFKIPDMVTILLKLIQKTKADSLKRPSLEIENLS